MTETIEEDILNKIKSHRCDVKNDQACNDPFEIVEVSSSCCSTKTNNHQLNGDSDCDSIDARNRLEQEVLEEWDELIRACKADDRCEYPAEENTGTQGEQKEALVNTSLNLKETESELVRSKQSVQNSYSNNDLQLHRMEDSVNRQKRVNEDLAVKSLQTNVKKDVPDLNKMERTVNEYLRHERRKEKRKRLKRAKKLREKYNDRSIVPGSWYARYPGTSTESTSSSTTQRYRANCGRGLQGNFPDQYDNETHQLLKDNLNNHQLRDRTDFRFNNPANDFHAQYSDRMRPCVTDYTRTHNFPGQQNCQSPAIVTGNIRSHDYTNQYYNPEQSSLGNTNVPPLPHLHGNISTDNFLQRDHQILSVCTQNQKLPDIRGQQDIKQQSVWFNSLGRSDLRGHLNEQQPQPQPQPQHQQQPQPQQHQHSVWESDRKSSDYSDQHDRQKLSGWTDERRYSEFRTGHTGQERNAWTEDRALPYYSHGIRKLPVGRDDRRLYDSRGQYDQQKRHIWVDGRRPSGVRDPYNRQKHWPSNRNFVDYCSQNKYNKNHMWGDNVKRGDPGVVSEDNLKRTQIVGPSCRGRTVPENSISEQGDNQSWSTDTGSERLYRYTGSNGDKRNIPERSFAGPSAKDRHVSVTNMDFARCSDSSDALNVRCAPPFEYERRRSRETQRYRDYWDRSSDPTYYHRPSNATNSHQDFVSNNDRRSRSSPKYICNSRSPQIGVHHKNFHVTIKWPLKDRS